jgi:hypothetical protein
MLFAAGMDLRMRHAGHEVGIHVPAGQLHDMAYTRRLGRGESIAFHNGEIQPVDRQHERPVDSRESRRERAGLFKIAFEDFYLASEFFRPRRIACEYANPNVSFEQLRDKFAPHSTRRAGHQNQWLGHWIQILIGDWRYLKAAA